MGGYYGQMAQVYDALAGRGEPFVQAALLAWAQAMLDQAAALTSEGAHLVAQSKYRALLQREHAWLAPITDRRQLRRSRGVVWTSADGSGPSSGIATERDP